MASGQIAFDAVADAVGAGVGYGAQKLSAMSRDAKIAVTTMAVVLGVIMIAQGSLAIQSFNTLQECRRGEATSERRNKAQIGLLTVGVAVLIGAMVAAGYLFKSLR